jgi:hypothetical protein
MTMIALTLVTVIVTAIATFLAISLGLGAFAEVHRNNSINEPEVPGFPIATKIGGRVNEGGEAANRT